MSDKPHLTVGVIGGHGHTERIVAALAAAEYMPVIDISGCQQQVEEPPHPVYAIVQATEYPHVRKFDYRTNDSIVRNPCLPKRWSKGKGGRFHE